MYVLGKLQSLLPSIADKIRLEDIDVSHPLPPTKKKRSRVIVKFVRRDIKNLVFFAKRELKMSPQKITITEHLSKYNLWLLERVREMVPFKDTWSSQCVVYALVRGTKVAIKGEKDLNYVQQKLKYHAPPVTVPSTTPVSSVVPPFSVPNTQSNIRLNDSQAERNAVIGAVKTIVIGATQTENNT